MSRTTDFLNVSEEMYSFSSVEAEELCSSSALDTCGVYNKAPKEELKPPT